MRSARGRGGADSDRARRVCSTRSGVALRRAPGAAAVAGPAPLRCALPRLAPPPSSPASRQHTLTRPRASAWGDASTPTRGQARPPLRRQQRQPDKLFRSRVVRCARSRPPPPPLPLSAAAQRLQQLSPHFAPHSRSVSRRKSSRASARPSRGSSSPSSVRLIAQLLFGGGNRRARRPPAARRGCDRLFRDHCVLPRAQARPRPPGSRRGPSPRAPAPWACASPAGRTTSSRFSTPRGCS